MLKSLLIILIMAVSNCNALSQTRPDSTVLADRDIKALLSAFDEWKVLSAENPLLVKRVALLEGRLQVKDSIIINLDQIIDMNGKIIQDYVASEKNLIQQRASLEKQNKSLNKDIKKQKTKTFITATAGVVGMVLLLFIIK